MDKKLNEFNNGRDTTDGVGGKTMFDEMREAGSKLPDIVEFLQQNGWKTKNNHDNWVNENYIGEHSINEAFDLEKEYQETPLKNAIKVLQKHLKEDKSGGSYYYSWQANIACCIMDEYNEAKYNDLMPRLANDAAKRFLDLLISQ